MSQQPDTELEEWLMAWIPIEEQPEAKQRLLAWRDKVVIKAYRSVPQIDVDLEKANSARAFNHAVFQVSETLEAIRKEIYERTI